MDINVLEMLKTNCEVGDHPISLGRKNSFTVILSD